MNLGDKSRDIQHSMTMAVQKGQERAVDAVRHVIDVAEPFVEELAGTVAPLGARLAGLRSELPKRQKVVTEAYGVVQSLLAAQRQMAERILEGALPLLGVQRHEGVPAPAAERENGIGEQAGATGASPAPSRKPKSKAKSKAKSKNTAKSG